MTTHFLFQQPKDPLRQMAEGVEAASRNQPFELVLVVLGGLLALFVIGFFFHSRWTGGGTSSHFNWALFKELSRANRLGFSERRLLRRIVRASGSPDSAVLFLRQTVFDAGVARIGSENAEAESLRRKLFHS